MRQKSEEQSDEGETREMSERRETEKKGVG